MKLLRKMLALVALSSLFAMPAFADKCKDPIVDEMGALSSSDVTQIEKSMNALSQKGADVHVQVVDSFHRNAEGQMNKSLDAYSAMMKSKCKSWQAPNGGMKNNLIVVLVAPKQKTKGLYNGDQWQNAIEPVRQRIYSDTMNPRFREGKIGDGIAKALDDVTDVVSVKASQANKPITIVHAADNSGLWKVLGWLLGLGALGLLVYVAFRVFGESEKRRGAQRNAQTVRGQCTQSLNGFDGRFALLDAKVKQANVDAEWKTRLNDMLERARSAYVAASSQFSALDRSANNPDTPRLSVAEYAGMEKRYTDAARGFAEADRLLATTETNLARALRGEPVSETKTPAPDQQRVCVDETPQQTTAPRAQTSSGSGTARGSSGARPHHHEASGHTIVVHDDSGPGFLTGVVVGEMMSDHHDRIIEREVVVDRGEHYRGDPVIANPDFDSPRREPEGGGKAADWGTTSEGSGTAQSFGETTDGGGRSESWDDSKSGTAY